MSAPLVACAPAASSQSGGEGPRRQADAPSERVASWPTIEVLAPAGLVPDAVISAFETRAEQRVVLIPSASMRDTADLVAGGKQADLALIPGDQLARLIRDTALAPLDHGRLPAFKHIDPAFRDLVHDPGNRHSVPMRYGTMGILTLVGGDSAPPARWADLWDATREGALGVHDRPRDLIAAALMADGREPLGDVPDTLDIARRTLIDLPRKVEIFESSAALIEAFSAGRIDYAIGRPTDLALARSNDPPIDLLYVVPAEGSTLWSDHWVLPATSRRPKAATALLDHLLDPEQADQIAREGGIALANSTAMQALPAGVRSDRASFPRARTLSRGRLLPPLSPAGQVLQDALWQELRAHFEHRMPEDQG